MIQFIVNEDFHKIDFIRQGGEWKKKLNSDVSRTMYKIVVKTEFIENKVEVQALYWVGYKSGVKFGEVLDLLTKEELEEQYFRID